MRKTYNQQLPLAEVTPDHPKAKEFAQISAILDSNNSIYLLALQDLGISGNNVGANGMTAEKRVLKGIVHERQGSSNPEEVAPFFGILGEIAVYN